MMSVVCRWHVLLLLLLASVHTFAQQETPEQLLDRMSHSFRELQYRGVFTYEYGPEMESMEIFHGVRDGVEVERLVYLNGPYREVLRHGHSLSCIHPGDEILRLGHTVSSGPFARSFLENDSNIADHYDLSLGAEARVAGHDVRLVEVKPRDRYRNGYHLYLDEASGLLLKSMVVSPEGKVLERFQFATVEINAEITDQQLSPGGSDNPQLQGHQVLSQDTVEQALYRNGDIELDASWLPPGFTVAARQHQPQDGRASDLAMYTDGLASLSIYIEPLVAGSPAARTSSREGRARKGATVAYTRRLQVDEQVILITVVGEVPLFTAHRVARQITVRKVG